jgi:hypothetical protein
MTAPSLHLPASGTVNRRPVSVLSRGDVYLRFLAWVLAGYAIGDKGFAYIGVPPLYVGELSLLSGVVVGGLSSRAHGVFHAPVTALLVAFMAWGAVCTLPYLGTFGIEALRDAVVWAYAVLALVVGGLVIARPLRLGMLVARYRRFVPVFLVLMPVVWVAAQARGESSPVWPWSGTPILFAKAGDFLVHLTGVTAFIACGFNGRARLWISVLLTLDVILTGYATRGGLLAYVAGVGLCVLARPRNRVTLHLGGLIAAAVLLLAVSGVRIPLGNYREISMQQFVEHIRSTTGTSSNEALEGTKLWRVAWWASIVDYTFAGERFWTGKGYGINLADDDGYQVTEDGSLRSPHNVHMTILARSGVTGLVLWLALQGVWAGTLVRTFWRSRRAGHEEWARLFIWLLSYWLSMLIVATFDVYLEGPMGGIWFWVVFGVGIGAIEIYRREVRARSALVSASGPSTGAATPGHRASSAALD